MPQKEKEKFQALGIEVEKSDGDEWESTTYADKRKRYRIQEDVSQIIDIVKQSNKKVVQTLDEIMEQRPTPGTLENVNSGKTGGAKIEELTSENLIRVLNRDVAAEHELREPLFITVEKTKHGRQQNRTIAAVGKLNDTRWAVLMSHHTRPIPPAARRRSTNPNPIGSTGINKKPLIPAIGQTPTTTAATKARPPARRPSRTIALPRIEVDANPLSSGIPVFDEKYQRIFNKTRLFLKSGIHLIDKRDASVRLQEITKAIKMYAAILDVIDAYDSKQEKQEKATQFLEYVKTGYRTKSGITLKPVFEPLYDLKIVKV